MPTGLAGSIYLEVPLLNVFPGRRRLSHELQRAIAAALFLRLRFRRGGLGCEVAVADELFNRLG